MIVLKLPPQLSVDDGVFIIYSGSSPKILVEGIVEVFVGIPVMFRLCTIYSLTSATTC